MNLRNLCLLNVNAFDLARKRIRSTAVLVVAFAAIAVTSGCGVVKVDTSMLEPKPADPDITFIDLDSFDTLLSRDINEQTELVIDEVELVRL